MILTIMVINHFTLRAASNIDDYKSKTIFFVKGLPP